MIAEQRKLFFSFFCYENTFGFLVQGWRRMGAGR